MEIIPTRSQNTKWAVLKVILQGLVDALGMGGQGGLGWWSRKVVEEQLQSEKLATYLKHAPLAGNLGHGAADVVAGVSEQDGLCGPLVVGHVEKRLRRHRHVAL